MDYFIGTAPNNESVSIKAVEILRFSPLGGSSGTCIELVNKTQQEVKENFAIVTHHVRECMRVLVFTRPNNTHVGINPAEIVEFMPVPGDGPLPKGAGVRIKFTNAMHQDVREHFAEVSAALSQTEAHA